MAFNMSHDGAVQENHRCVYYSCIHADAVMIQRQHGFCVNVKFNKT